MSDTVLVALLPAACTLVGTIVTTIVTGISNRKKTEEKIENIGKKLDAHIKENEYNEAESRRVRILRFDDDLCNPSIPYPSEANFMQARSDVDYYRNFIQTHKDFTNGIGESAMQHIEDVWDDCKHKNLFGEYK